jgi:DNA-binding beta-propeller fold protein YncE
MRVVAAGVLLLVVWFAQPAPAENVVEGWRSPFGSPGRVAVNPSDGSVWAVMGGNLMHLRADGRVLGQAHGLVPGDCSADPTDGSCWVSDRSTNQIVQVAPDGTELQRWGTLTQPPAVAVNTSDGSLWATDRSTDQVVHFTREGAEIWRGGSFHGIRGVWVNSSDGSCWVTDGTYFNGSLTHVAEDGAELWRSTDLFSPASVTVDPRDDSIWVTDGDPPDLIHLTAEGAEVLRLSGGFGMASVDPSDGSLWTVLTSSHEVVHLTDDGVEVWRSGPYNVPVSPSVNPWDGSCWIGDRFEGQLVHLSAGGAELWRGGLFAQPSSVSADASDGSCWVGDDDYTSGWVTHLTRDGDVDWRKGGFQRTFLATNAADGSCWIADPPGNQLSHWGADGATWWRSDDFQGPGPVAVDESGGYCWFIDSGGHQVVRVNDSGVDLAVPGVQWSSSVSVSQVDGSAWFADYGLKQVVHVGSDGHELWRGDFAAPTMVAAGSGDGACWLIDDSHLVRLDASGAELWRSDTYYDAWCSLAVSPADGTLWVADTADNQVVHVAPDGTERWRGGNFSRPSSVSVDPVRGSVWVADTMDGQVVRLDLPDWRPPRFQDVPFDHWAWAQVEACALAGIVAGYPNGTYRPSQSVTRAQMAAYIARALAGGDTAVPAGPTDPSFTDVDGDHWAYVYIEYAHALGIVEGYGSGSKRAYQPDLEVDRGQMAVFVARAIATPTGETGMAGYTPPATPRFPDVTADSDWEWCYKYVEYIADPARNVVQGYPDGLYHPEYVCARDQMAVYLTRALNLPLP